MRKILMILAVITALVLGILGTSGIAMADKPEGPAVGPEGQNLCPAVGNETAALANGWFGGPIYSGDYTFNPGNNQAGTHANPNSYNTLNPDESPGPGGANSDWSPMWPGTYFED